MWVDGTPEDDAGESAGPVGRRPGRATGPMSTLMFVAFLACSGFLVAASLCWPLGVFPEAEVPADVLVVVLLTIPLIVVFLGSCVGKVATTAGHRRAERSTSGLWDPWIDEDGRTD